LWIEVDTKTVTKDDLKARMKGAQFKELLEPHFATLLSEQVNFDRVETPQFHLRYTPQRSAPVRLARGLLGRDVVAVEEAYLVHHALGRQPIELSTFTTADGLVTVSLKDGEQEKLRPGQYTVELVLNEGGRTYIETFDFQWGILAWNPDQTQYVVGDTAQFAIGALTQNGNTICQANLQLFITTPDVPLVFVMVTT
jgi:hypothetical protein